MRSNRNSDNIELADKSLHGTTVLIEPLPAVYDRHKGAILVGASNRLTSDLCLPVLKTYPGPSFINPLPLFHHVIDAQPDLFAGSNCLMHINIELVVFIACNRSAQSATL